MLGSDAVPYRLVLPRDDGYVNAWRRFLFDATARLFDNVYTAPAFAHHILLSAVARLLVSSPAGDWLMRKLLDDNGVLAVVELAAAIHVADPTLLPDVVQHSGKEFGLAEPLVRLSASQYAWHAERAIAMTTQPNSAPLYALESRTYRTVCDYHDAYRTQRTTPTAVLDKLLAFISDTNATLRCIEQVDEPGA